MFAIENAGDRSGQVMQNLFLIWLADGGALVSLSIPLILGKVPPNRWYGFRVAKTFSGESIWYAANRAAGYGLLGAGGSIALTAAISRHFMPLEAANALNFAVFVGALAIAIFHSFSTLKRL